MIREFAVALLLVNCGLSASIDPLDYHEEDSRISKEVSTRIEGSFIALSDVTEPFQVDFAPSPRDAEFIPQTYTNRPASQRAISRPAAIQSEDSWNPFSSFTEHSPSTAGRGSSTLFHAPYGVTKSPKRSELISPFTRQRPALRASALVAEAEAILESFSHKKAEEILVEAEKFFNHEGMNRSGASLTLRKHCKLIRKLLKERPREEARADAGAPEPLEQDALPVHESTPDALITPDSFESSSDRLSQNEPKFRPAVISREESTRQRAQSMITAVDDLLKNVPVDETLTKQVQSCQDMIESLWGIMSKDIRKKSPARKIAKQQDAKTMSLIDSLNSAVETIQARLQKKPVSCCAACLKIRLGTHFLQDPSASLMIWFEETYPVIDEIVADFAGDEIYWRSPVVLKGTRKRFGLVNLWPIQDARSIGTPPTDPHGAEPSLDIPLLNVPDPRQVPRETWKTLDSTLQKLAISQIWLSNYLLTSDVMLPENHKELESAALARLGAVTDQLSPLLMAWRQRVVRDSESESS